MIKNLKDGMIIVRSLSFVLNIPSRINHIGFAVIEIRDKCRVQSIPLHSKIMKENHTGQGIHPPGRFEINNPKI